MSFEEKIEELLRENMTEDGYKLWKVLFEKIPPVWDRLSSSSRKYHQDDNGHVRTIGEHTFEMLHACSKVMRMFKINNKCKEGDVLLLSIFLHDAFKYGIDDPLNTRHTDRRHDRIIGNTIFANKDKFLNLFDDKQVSLLEHITRYHSGIWSTDVNESFTLKALDPEALFVHILDMLSANNCLKIPIEDIKNAKESTS